MVLKEPWTPTKSSVDNYKTGLLEYDSCRQFNIKRRARSSDGGGSGSSGVGVYGGVLMALKNQRKIGISRIVILPTFPPLYREDNIDFIPFAYT